MSIPANLERIRNEIADACARAHRDPSTVALMAVSKVHPAEAILEAYAAGQRLFGENRVQEWQSKQPAVSAADIEMHLIGPLQNNKTTKASARSYIPEIPWNDGCTSRLIYSDPVNGSFSQSYGSNGFCNSTLGQSFVIDVAGGDKVPRKGGPGITRSDLLVINKTDLAPLVGADLAVMARDAVAVRGQRPTVFTSLVADPAAAEVAGWVRAVRSAVATAL